MYLGFLLESYCLLKLSGCSSFDVSVSSFYQSRCISFCSRRVVSVLARLRPHVDPPSAPQSQVPWAHFPAPLSSRALCLSLTRSVSATLSLYAFIFALPVKALSTFVKIRSRNSLLCGFVALPCDVSAAIRVECHVFLQFFRHQRLQTSELDLIVECTLQPCSRSARRRIPYRSIPAWSSNRELLPREMIVRSFSPYCLRVISCLPSSACLQRVLPRVCDNIISLITCERHECWEHLLQQVIQIVHSFLSPRSSKSARSPDR